MHCDHIFPKVVTVLGLLRIQYSEVLEMFCCFPLSLTRQWLYSYEFGDSLKCSFNVHELYQGKLLTVVGQHGQLLTKYQLE